MTMITMMPMIFDDHDNSPAKEEKDEAKTKDDAREKKKGEKHRQMLKLHFEQVFLHHWYLESLSGTRIRPEYGLVQNIL